MTHVRPARRWPRSAIAAGRWALAGLLCLALGGCATPPPAEAPAPPAPAEPAPAAASSPPPACPSCDEQEREVARLRRELAAREEELRELRTNQREQVKIIQESTREVTRAKVKLRRLATQAEAASYIAEVEVALASSRAAGGAAATSALLDLAQATIAATAAPFAQGDYGTAMDRAAQAEQLIAVAADLQGQARSRAPVSGEMLLQASIPLRASVDGPLRREPRRSAAVAGSVKKGAPVVARAYKGGWLRVDTEGGRSGWIEHSKLGAR